MRLSNEDTTVSEESSQPPKLRSVQLMQRMIGGFMVSQPLMVAAKLGIADLVEEAPRTADELAHATKSHAPSLRRLLRFLTLLGIFAEDASGKYRQTPLSETLRANHPESVRYGAMMYGSSTFWRSWGDLYQTILTGEPAFDRIYGESHYDYLRTHPDDAAIFNAAMSSGAPLALSAIPTAYDFSQFERIVDVGGGHGALLDGILSANPRLRGVLIDQPEVVAGATTLRAGANAHRCETIGGNFFESIPAGADGYLMKAVIHNWNDDDALKILRNCRRAIRDDGTLLLIERVLKPGNEPDPERGMDLNMLVMLRGRERTEAEFRALLEDAGFRLTRVIAMPLPWSIIECQAI